MFGWFKKRSADVASSGPKEEVARRLVEQRVRNRMMEELHSLSEGDASVREYGAGEYFNSFFDWFPGAGHASFSNTAMTKEEHDALSLVLSLMHQACEATPRMVGDDELIRSGWPARIATAAQDTLTLFAQRGRFSEEHEETMPSNLVAWP